MINRDWLIAGIDIPIVDYEIIMHNPSVKEILSFESQNFFVALQFLSLDKNDVSATEDVDLAKLSDFQILMQIINLDNGDKKFILKKTLELLFPEYKIYITPRSIVLTLDDFSLTIDELNFNILKQVLRDVFVLELDNFTSEYRPANKKAAEIMAKLEKAKQRAAMVDNKQFNKGTSILAKGVSVLSVGLETSYQEILDLTMFQYFDLFKRLLLKVEWDLYIKQLLVGGKPDPVDNWLEKDLYL